MFSIDLSKYRLVDLSFEVVPGAIEDRPFDATRGRLIDDCFKFDVSRTHTHVGTHVELPAHYFEDGADVTAFGLEAFMGRGVVFHIDASLNGLAIDAEYFRERLGSLIQPGDSSLCRNEIPASWSTSTQSFAVTSLSAIHAPFFGSSGSKYANPQSKRMPKRPLWNQNT